FAVAGDTRLRSLEKDDVAAASTVYQNGSMFGSISGAILASGGGGISGAHLVAEDSSGAPASSTLSHADGTFSIQGLPQGSYTVYAEPLDGPVVGHNLSLGISGQKIDTGFGTTFFGGASNPTSVFVNTGSNTSLGTITARAQTTMRLSSSSPSAVHPGDTTTITASGAGLDSQDTPSITGSGFTITSSAVSAGSVSLTVSVGSNALTGLHSIHVVRLSGDARVLTGAVEVRNAAPSLSAISPTSGTPGTPITLTGKNLGSGGTAILGSGIVESPSATGTTASFACPTVDSGTYDVTFQNADGQFAAIKKAFTVTGGSSPSAPSGGNSPPPAITPSAFANNPTPAPTAPAQSAPSSVPMGGGGGGGGGSSCELEPAPVPASTLAPLAALALALCLARFGRARTISS
ncbi:carboxypeptidase regulatory-like domain-containing protein, partial [bacterium]|nr:carboxypeptidase regulatory-like domain-containing protein [bacterium]